MLSPQPRCKAHGLDGSVRLEKRSSQRKLGRIESESADRFEELARTHEARQPRCDARAVEPAKEFHELTLSALQLEALHAQSGTDRILCGVRGGPLRHCPRSRRHEPASI